MKIILTFIGVFLVIIIGLFVVTVLFMGPHSQDTLQQSKLACEHAVKVLVGNEYSIVSTEYVKNKAIYKGYAASQKVDCSTSLFKREITSLEINKENKLDELEILDRKFNPQLDYYHNH